MTAVDMNDVSERSDLFAETLNMLNIYFQPLLKIKSPLREEIDTSGITFFL